MHRKKPFGDIHPKGFLFESVDCLVDLLSAGVEYAPRRVCRQHEDLATTYHEVGDLAGEGRQFYELTTGNFDQVVGRGALVDDAVYVSSVICGDVEHPGVSRQGDCLAPAAVALRHVEQIRVKATVGILQPAGDDELSGALRASKVFVMRKEWRKSGRQVSLRLVEELREIHVQHGYHQCGFPESRILVAGCVNVVAVGYQMGELEVPDRVYDEQFRRIAVHVQFHEARRAIEVLSQDGDDAALGMGCVEDVLDGEDRFGGNVVSGFIHGNSYHVPAGLAGSRFQGDHHDLAVASHDLLGQVIAPVQDRLFPDFAPFAVELGDVDGGAVFCDHVAVAVGFVICCGYVSCGFPGSRGRYFGAGVGAGVGAGISAGISAGVGASVGVRLGSGRRRARGGCIRRGIGRGIATATATTAGRYEEQAKNDKHCRRELFHGFSPFVALLSLFWIPQDSDTAPHATYM